MIKEKISLYKNILLSLFSITMFWSLALNVIEKKTTVWNYLFNTGYGLIFFICGFFLLFLIREYKIYGTPQKAINLISIGFISYSIALFIWTYYNLCYEETVPYPSIADLFFILYYPLIFISVFYFIKMFSVLATKRIFIETAIVLFATSFLMIYFIRPEIDPKAQTLENILNIFYPLTNAIILSSSIMMLRISQGGIAKGSLLLSIGIMLNGIGDLFFTLREISGEYWNGDFTDTLAATSAFVMGWGLLNIVQYLIPEEITNEKQNI